MVPTWGLLNESLAGILSVTRRAPSTSSPGQKLQSTSSRFGALTELLTNVRPGMDNDTVSTGFWHRERENVGTGQVADIHIRTPVYYRAACVDSMVRPNRKDEYHVP